MLIVTHILTDIYMHTNIRVVTHTLTDIHTYILIIKKNYIYKNIP